MLASDSQKEEEDTSKYMAYFEWRRFCFYKISFFLKQAV
jgi:hypothetical protein